MSEYIPTKEDLEDFEEFQKEREAFFLNNGRKIYADSYLITRNEIQRKYFKLAILDILICTISVLEDIKKSTLLERLNLVELLGYDKYEIISIINPDLSKDEIDKLLKGYNYKYLYKGLETYFGDQRIDEAILARERSVKYNTLPFIAFNHYTTCKDKELILVKKQLIEETDKHNRQLYWMRNFILRKGNDLGWWDCDEQRIDNVVKVPTKRFLQSLFYRCQHQVEALRYMFDVTVTKYAIKKGYVRFTIPIAYIPLIESYFDVELDVNSISSYKRGTMTIVTLDDDAADR